MNVGKKRLEPLRNSRSKSGEKVAWQGSLQPPSDGHGLLRLVLDVCGRPKKVKGALVSPLSGREHDTRTHVDMTLMATPGLTIGTRPQLALPVTRTGYGPCISTVCECTGAS